MSVLIKGINMPKSCALCFYRDDFHNYCPYEANKERDCPLIEVSTPHGRLIDADEVPYFASSPWKAIATQSEIEKMPTIIEAEKGANNENL